MEGISRDKIIRLYKLILEARNEYKALNDLNMKEARNKGYENRASIIAATGTGHWNAYNWVLAMMIDEFKIIYEEVRGE